MDLEVGQVVDGYRITGVLGRGGMGVVYKAEDTALSRDVALKVILANLTRDDQFIRRFQTEARTLAQVDSPYIVRVHALRETEAGWFIVMEYVAGGTVADLLEGPEGGLDVDTCLPIIRQMFQAFEHAHGAGIIHRDIKPENVMLTKKRRVKIADFGLAKQSSPDTLATVTQGMMGTLYYMSPEQVRGLGEVDHRSDLWALGVVMYEMLTGRRPFKATYEAAVLYSILNEEPEPITAADGDIPQGLQDIIFRLLEKDQDARYQSARDVLDALDNLDAAKAGLAMPAAGQPASPTSDSGSSAQRVTSDSNGTTLSPAPPATVSSGPGDEAGDSLLHRIKETVTLKRFAQGFTLVLAVTAAVINFWGVISSRTNASSNDRFLSIETTPSGATVIVDGREAEPTPLERFAVPGRESEKPVQIRLEGFVEIDTVLSLGQRHSFALTPVAEETQDDPALAANDAGEDTNSDPADTGLESTPNEDDQTSTPVTSPPRRGSMTVNVQPEGNIFIDGNSVDAGTSVSLAAGSHRIRITHVLYGELTHSVTIPAGGSESVTCHLTGDVNVVSQPWGRVVIDGETTEHVTPTVLELPGGTYDIGVRKFGYEAEQTDGPAGPITISPSCDERDSYRLVFQLTEQ